MPQGLVVSSDHYFERILVGRIDELSEYSILVPVRDPFDIAVSLLVWRSVESKLTEFDVSYTMAILEEIARHWEAVLTLPELFTIIDFNKLVTNVDYTKAALETRFPLLAGFVSDASVTDSTIKNAITQDDTEEYETKPELIASRGHVPREAAGIRAIAIDTLKSKMYDRKLNYLNNLYLELLERSI